MSPSRLHALIHGRVFYQAMDTLDKYEWCIDLDIEINDTTLRPDIVAFNNDDDIEIVIEISNSTIKYDLSAKKSLFEYLKIPYYLVYDCNKATIHRFQLNHDGIYESTHDIFPELTDGVFKLGL